MNVYNPTEPDATKSRHWNAEAERRRRVRRRRRLKTFAGLALLWGCFFGIANSLAWHDPTTWLVFTIALTVITTIGSEP